MLHVDVSLSWITEITDRTVTLISRCLSPPSCSGWCCATERLSVLAERCNFVFVDIGLMSHFVTDTRMIHPCVMNDILCIERVFHLRTCLELGSSCSGERLYAKVTWFALCVAADMSPVGNYLIRVIIIHTAEGQ